MFCFKEIYSAYLKCRKRKRNTYNALKFEQNLIENICNLETLLNSRAYTPMRSICFLTTSPKLREVFAANFADRVIHHVVVPILEQIYEPRFIYDSYSNRANKGIHNATQRAKKFSRGSNYYLQLDIRNFFYTIDKNILYNKLITTIKNNYHKVKNTSITLDEILWLIKIIIYQDVTKDVIIKGDKRAFENIPPHKTLFGTPKHLGLPIGNLTSQFFANVYMNDFDNYIKRVLKCKRYIRYVDDFVLFEDSRDKLLQHYDDIVNYLRYELKLSLRDRYIIKQNHQGLDFLGYIIRPHYTLTRRRVVKNFKYKKARFLNNYENSNISSDKSKVKKYLEIKASFLGHIKHSNSNNLKKKVYDIDDTKYIKNIFEKG
jgi:hypothetical protein